MAVVADDVADDVAGALIEVDAVIAIVIDSVIDEGATRKRLNGNADAVVIGAIIKDNVIRVPAIDVDAVVGVVCGVVIGNIVVVVGLI